VEVGTVEALASLMLAQFMSGLTRAMILFMVASGLSLIFGTMSVLNFAHGSYYMIGAFFCYELLQVFGSSLGFWGSVIVASVLIAAVGVIIEIFIMRRTYAMGHTAQLLLTYGLVLIAGDVVRMGWGGRFYSLAGPESLSGTMRILGVGFPIYNVFVVLLGFAIFGGLWLLIYKTKMGMIIRASVTDRELVSALGIPIPKVFTFVFALGIFLAGVAGGAYAPLSTICVGMDISLLIESFAVIIIGGVGRLSGTLLGALIVGEVYSFGILVAPDLALAFIFLVLVIVLIVRPFGLLGRPIV
jgi:branched-subunit amino acid ABC-type transport system permease component